MGLLLHVVVVSLFLEVLKFSHSWHNGPLPEVFDNTFQYTRNIHKYNTRYSAKQNFYKYKVTTTAGKQSVSYMAIDIWKDLPSSLKDVSYCQNKNRTNFPLS